MTAARPLWTCPECGAKFVSKNLWHSCGEATLDDWKARMGPKAHAFFSRFEEMIAQWCAEHERDHEATKREVTRQLTAAGYRAGGVTVEHLSEIVQQILEGLA